MPRKKKPKVKIEKGVFSMSEPTPPFPDDLKNMKLMKTKDFQIYQRVLNHWQDKINESNNLALGARGRWMEALTLLSIVNLILWLITVYSIWK